jgi:CrcB protein
MSQYWIISSVVLAGGLVWGDSRSPLPADTGRLSPPGAKLGTFAPMLATVLVFIGGALGSLWRFWWSGLVARHFGETFPFGTLVVNIIASLLLGMISGSLAHVADRQLAASLHQLLAVGVCGGLSTFSSLSLQTWNLLLERRWFAALLNIVVSTALCFAGVALGWQLLG